MKGLLVAFISVQSIFILVDDSKASPDLSVYNPVTQSIAGFNYPRFMDKGYYHKSLRDSDTSNILKSMFNKNRTISIHSDLLENIDMKLRGKKVDDDTYKFIRKTPLKALIKSEQNNYQKDLSSRKVISSFLKSYDKDSFESTFLNSDIDSVENSLFVKVNSSQITSSRYDYTTIQLSGIKNVFDHGYYAAVKSASSSIENSFYVSTSIDDAVVDAYEIRRSDNTIRYGFYEQYTSRGSIVLVFEGEKSKCIVKVSDFNFSHCDISNSVITPKNISPKLIGIIKKCQTGTQCSIDESIWSNFDTFSSRKLSSDDRKSIENAFSDKSSSYLHFEKPMLPVSGGSFPNTVAINDPNFDELNDIAHKDSIYHGLKVKRIYTDYTSKSSLSVTYELSDSQCRKASKAGEECLALGESLYFQIPQEFQDKSISEMTIAHRQNVNDNRGTDSFNSSTGAKTKDKYPSFISAQIYSSTLPYKFAWRYWGGHISGINGGKYSEQKKNNSWEFDNLYEWPLHGHRASHQQLKKSITPLKGKYVRIFADEGKFSQIKGYDTAYVHSVTIQFTPTKADLYKSWSFTHSKTDLGDPLTMKGRKYGGGPKFYGQYPGAIILKNSRTPKNTDQLDNTSWDYSRRGYIDYKLIAGKKLKSVEIAAGDTHPDGRPNKDGGTGSLGGAKLSAILITNNKEEKLIDYANLGPKGVTTGYPNDLNRVIQPGETLRVYGHNDNAYIMGIRIGYGN